MNFTREPIVETIISAKEGFKLSLKSSKHVSQDEYLVDAVEVVSFSGALFYRSQEKPKPFFLPIHDYEVQEVREAKLAIRSPIVEKSIKIGGGKESFKQQKTESQENAPSAQDESIAQVVKNEGENPKVVDRPKREKRQKYRRKRGNEDAVKQSIQKDSAITEDGELLPVQVPVEAIFSHLLKPPESLISESIHKYKKYEEESLKSPEVVIDLQVDPSISPSLTKEEGVEFFSEPPKENEKFVEEIVESETLIFSPTDLEKREE